MVIFYFLGLDKRHVLWFATLDGALGHVIPCNEKTYRRLLMLQNVLATDIHHNAGTYRGIGKYCQMALNVTTIHLFRAKSQRLSSSSSTTSRTGEPL